MRASQELCLVLFPIFRDDCGQASALTHAVMAASGGCLQARPVQIEQDIHVPLASFDVGHVRWVHFEPHSAFRLCQTDRAPKGTQRPSWHLVSAMVNGRRHLLPVPGSYSGPTRGRHDFVPPPRGLSAAAVKSTRSAAEVTRRCQGQLLGGARRVLPFQWRRKPLQAPLRCSAFASSSRSFHRSSTRSTQASRGLSRAIRIDR